MPKEGTLLIFKLRVFSNDKAQEEIKWGYMKKKRDKEVPVL